MTAIAPALRSSAASSPFPMPTKGNVSRVAYEHDFFKLTYSIFHTGFTNRAFNNHFSGWPIPRKRRCNAVGVDSSRRHFEPRTAFPSSRRYGRPPLRMFVETGYECSGSRNFTERISIGRMRFSQQGHEAFNKPGCFGRFGISTKFFPERRRHDT